MADTIHLGFEVGTGSSVSIPIHHLAVTGQTRLSGKTTTIEALLSRLPATYHALLFSTKRGELAFSSVPRVKPFYRQHTDWEYVESLLEAAMKERMRLERSFIINACKGTHTLRQVYDNIIKGRKEARRGFDEAIFTNLQAYFEKVLPQLEANPFADTLSLVPGANVMDLGHLSEEVQALVIAACLDELHANASKTVIVIPEAWKFIPQSRGNPVKWAAEHVVREGGASQLWLWFDAQDITGMDKQPLKSVGVWLLGRQMELNEIRRVLAQVPLSKKPRPEDVARLPVGHFYTAAEDWCRPVYVQPQWLDQDRARQVALGALTSSDLALTIPHPAEFVANGHTGPDTNSGQFPNLPNCLDEEDPAMIADLKMQLANTEAERDEATRQLGEKDQLIAKHQAGLDALSKQMDDWLPRVQAAARFSDALREFLGHATMPLDQPALDLDILAEKVAARLGVHQLQQGPPIETLKHQFQEEVVARLHEQVQAMDERPRKAILWLLSVGRPAKHMEICRRLGFPAAGASFAKFGTGIKEAVAKGFLVLTPADGLDQVVRDKVAAELAPYKPLPEVVEATYQHLLGEIAKDHAQP